MANRQYVQQEWRLLSYWLATYHPNATIYMNVRLGPVMASATSNPLDEQTATASRVYHRYADALFLEQGQPTLVEAKMEPDPGIFSQLIHYARLFRSDPAWKQYASQQLSLIAVVYGSDPTVQAEAPFYGVRWITYQPNLTGLTPPNVRFAPIESAGENVPLPSNWASRLQSWGIKALSDT
jgi:hypothetical protein